MFDEEQQNGDFRQPDESARRAVSVPYSASCEASAERADVDSARDLAKDQLARLDRTVFDAISGNSYALEELRILWPALRLELPSEMVDQARDEYLTAAIDIWSQYRAQELPNPEQAAAALDVMCLLFDD